MNTINKPLENMGGLIKIWAVPPKVISVSGKNVSISDYSDVYEIYCSPDSCQHDENPDHPEAGLIYNTEVSGFSPGDNAISREAFAHMDSREYAVVFIDGNGNYRLAGNNLDPLRFYANFSTGRNSFDRPGHQISFTGKTLQKAIVVNNPF
jgi:hypothetical protein